MVSRHAFILAAVMACNPASMAVGDDVSPPADAAAESSTPAGEPFRAMALRERLVKLLIARGDLHPGRVADAMKKVPRHAFVPGVSLEDAYADRPMPIGFDQTISQPTIVAIMTEALELSGSERVLEVGTGSGYQAAILAVLAREVYSIELVDELARSASHRLADRGYANVHVRSGDGYLGWPAKAPFDRVLVTAAPDAVPRTLLDQLADGGILVAPVGPSAGEQRLLRYRKSKGKLLVTDLGAVAFVPMVKP